MSSCPPSATTAGHVLLICPPIFSYHRSIQAALESSGYVVTWWDDRGTSTTLRKAALRLLPNLTSRLLEPLFHRKLEAAKATAVTHILIIKGEGLSTRMIRSIQRQWPEAKSWLYFWDGIANMPRARQIAACFDSVSTFDPVDAERFGWTYRPLFAREEAAQLKPPSGAEYDWCFVGTLHSDRYQVIERLRRSAPQQRSFVFCFVPSRLLMLGRLLADRSLWRAPRGSLSTRPMAPQRVAEILSISRAVLDVEHPGQRGLTMRSIETLLAGRKLITTNAHIGKSDLYDASRVHIVTRASPHVPSAFLEAEFVPVDIAVRKRYLLVDWLSDLMRTPKVAG